VWLLSPFVPIDEVRDAWRNAVRRARGEANDDDAVIVYLREVRTRPRDFAHELLKGADAIRLARLETTIGGEDVIEYATGWCIDEVRGQVPDAVLARVYEALEKRRVVQGSRGFLPPHVSVCRACGVVHPRMHVVGFDGHGQCANASIVALTAEPARCQRRPARGRTILAAEFAPASSKAWERPPGTSATPGPRERL
jgi:hypothetical protein